MTVGALALLVALAVSLSLRRPGSAESVGAKVGEPAPPLEGSTLDGRPFTLADLKDHVVLVNFWATWCDPCREEIPQLIKVYDRYRGDGFVILGVSVDEDGPRPVSTFAEKFHVTYPLLMPSEASVDRWNLFGIPATFLLDRRGVVVHRYFGFPGLEKLSREVESAIKTAP